MPAPRTSRRRRAAAVTLVAALAVAAPAPASPPRAPEDDGLPWKDAALDGPALEATGEATIHASPGRSGRPGDALDGRVATAFVAAAPGAAALVLELKAARVVREVETAFGNAATVDWRLDAGPSVDDLETVASSTAAPRTWSPRIVLPRPVAARVWRVVASARDGAPCAFAEVALVSRQRAVAVEIVAPSRVVASDGQLPVHARIRFDGGWTETSVQGLEFRADEGAPFRLFPVHPWADRGVTVHRDRDDEGVLVARVRGHGKDLESAPLVLRCVERGTADPAVAWIERLPRVRRDEGPGELRRGSEAIHLRAAVRNDGTGDAPRVRYRWIVDGREAGAGWIDGLGRFGTGTADLRIPAAEGERDVRFEVDPQDAIAESREDDNAAALRTDALAVSARIDRDLREAYRAAAGRDDPSCIEHALRLEVEAASRELERAGTGLTLSLDRVEIVDARAPPPQAPLDTDDGTSDLAWSLPASLLAGSRAATPGASVRGAPGALLRRLVLRRGAADLSAAVVPRAALAVPGAASLAGSGESAYRPAARGVLAGETGGLDELSAAWLRLHADRRGTSGPLAPGAVLFAMPARCRVALRDASGAPATGATLRLWRRDAEGTFSGEPVFRGVAREGGLVDLGEGEAWFGDGPRDASGMVLLAAIGHGGATRWTFLDSYRFHLAAVRGAATHEEPLSTEP